ncbi:GNAT family N-acetyltransferase [Amycolatopsis anabasis]|uniref:GNAT family N-acetyltransferase n=1 Tax=Amycolatopsis anabasis TaxID=1840409 RepID=UPI00131AC371|nr:GNAT family N-acetyltransferase [Amycolatopsis anabasis]
MDTPAEELADGDLVLRRWRLDDADAAYRAVSESIDHLAPWTAWAVHGYTERDAVEFVERCQDNWRNGESYDYAIVTARGTIVGGCGMMARIGPGGLEIGYWIGKRYTGRGLATRATALLVDEAFRIGADRVEIVHDAANVRSGAIPARLGFTEVHRGPRQGTLTPGESGIDVVWRLER